MPAFGPKPNVSFFQLWRSQWIHNALLQEVGKLIFNSDKASFLVINRMFLTWGSNCCVHFGTVTKLG